MEPPLKAYHQFSGEDIVIVPGFDILSRHFTNARGERFHLYRQRVGVFECRTH